jgi:Tfp pilus assembly protein PilV
MKQLLIILVLLFSFSGCQDAKEEQAQHDAQVAQQAKAELLAELKAKEESLKKEELELKKSNKLSKIGITTENGKIIIDTNKTKSFFKNIATKMKNKMEKLSKDIENGMIKDQNAGIEVDDTHINIDLNKTKSFLENFGKKMQEFVKEFDTIAEEIDKTNKGQ